MNCITVTLREEESPEGEPDIEEALTPPSATDLESALSELVPPRAGRH